MAREPVDRIFDGMPSVEDIRLAFRAWHHPVRLAGLRLSHSKLVRHRLKLSEGDAVNDLATVPVVRELLLDAIRQLKSVKTGLRNQHTELHASLAYRKYVLQQSEVQLCQAEGMSAATLGRHLLAELNELCAIVASMTLALPANGANYTAPRALFSAEIPSCADFVGRQAALAQARDALLSAHAGVVAITGYSGAGKSTLAAMLARDAVLAQRYPDGVLWAGVGRVDGVRDVLTRWIQEIGLEDHGVGKLPIEQQRSAMRTALAGKRVLFVLDDIWRSDDAHALMLGGIGAAYLVTTRQPAIAHDIATTVVSLDDFDQDETRALLQHHLPDAVLHKLRLNVDLSELAQQLRGLPLAVSVAARHLARLAKTGQPRRFSEYVKQVYPQDRAHALVSRLRETLNGLSDAERCALSTLALLPPKPNTFSERFALAVCECDLATLDALTDMALLEAQLGRFALHPAIAECVAVTLVDDAAKQRLAEHTAQVLQDPTQTALNSHDVLNLCAALSAAEACALDEVYVNIAINSVWLLEDSGNLPVMAQVLERAMSKTTLPSQRQRLEMHLAHVRWLRQPSSEGFAELERVTAEAAQSGDTDLVAVAARTMADITFERDEFASAIDFAQSAALAWHDYQAKHKERVEAAALRRYMLRSSFDKLREMLVRVIPASIAKALPAEQIQVAATAKGWLDVLHGEVQPGLAQLTECFERAARHGYHLPEIFSAGALAWAYYHLGDYGKARMMGYHVIHAPHRDVYPDFVVQAYHALASSALAQGDGQGTWGFLIEGLNYADAHSVDALASTLHATLAQWHLQHGNSDEAQQCAETALHIAREWRFEPMIPAALAGLGTVEAAMNQRHAACKRFEEMAAYLTKSKVSPWTEAYCRLHHGRFLVAGGEWAAAEAVLARAIELGRRLGAPEFVGLGCLAMGRTKQGQGMTDDASSLTIEGTSVLRGIGYVMVDGRE
jgi:tetratricopeptide (TPR) repeat protein